VRKIVLVPDLAPAAPKEAAGGFFSGSLFTNPLWASAGFRPRKAKAGDALHQRTLEAWKFDDHSALLFRDVHFFSESRFLLVMAHRSESSSSASGTTSSSAGGAASSSAATTSGTHAVSDGGCGHERGCK
jgi:hypothetical protein